MMIFSITNFNNDNISEKTIIVLENLAKTYRERKHIVFASRETCDLLLNIKNIGPSSRACFLKIRNNLAQIGGLNKIAKIKVCIDFSIEDEKSIIVDNDSIIIPYTALLDSVTFQKSVLLCEDSQDCILFEVMAKYYSNKNRINYPISFEHINGGGSRINREFLKINNENPFKFCLCFADTDKKHPNGPIGSTAKPFIGLQNNPYAQFYILDIHEIELFFPFRGLSDAIQPPITKGQVDTIDYLIDIENAGLLHMNYLDLKKGISLNDVHALDCSYGIFWKELIGVIAPKTVKKQCLANVECICGNECMVINGFGENLLSKFLNYIQRLTFQKIRELLPAVKENMWLEWGELIFWWGCAPSGKNFSR